MRLWTLVLVVVGYLAGLYFYSRGFLLTRQALRLNSSCADVQHPDAPVRGCWLEARFKRAIVLVIDALRFDFVDRQTGADISPYFHNRLATVSRLLEERKHESLLLEFTADPPTTTLQRLKALTTGSLPTFIDAGTNFAGTAIDEDNIIDQLVALNRNVTFLGDDTWTALFPTQFHRKFPFPSFDVKDLHTVDDGVLAHLYDELDKPDWTVLVAHFLGVDHCGHKYGPSHPEMGRKLDQMDRMIANVTKLLADDTLLIIFGDHGMTTTGDHGGDSPDELAAALFLHSKVPLHSEESVDLVPTLSLLLDFPTPFSSLGMVIPQVFPRDQQMAAAKANVEQVVRYAHSYSKLSGEAALSSRLQPLLRTFDSLTPEELTVERCLETVRQMQRIFRDCWATFHGPWMLIGVLAMLETLSWTLRLMVDEDHSWKSRTLLKLATVVVELVAYFGQQEIIPVILHLLLSFQLVLDLIAIVNGLMVVKQNRLPSTLHALPFLLVLLYPLCFFSNSFVVYERDIARYLAQACLLLLLVERKNAGLQRKPGTAAPPKITSFRRLIAVYFDWKAVAFTTVGLVMLRMGIAFARCREEQAECVPSWLTASFQSIHDDGDKRARFLVALASVAFLVGAMRTFLQRNGHLDGHSFKSMAVGAVPLLSFTAIAVYWVSLWLPDNVWQNYQTAFSLAPPLVVYTLSFLLTVLLTFNPLLINIVVGAQKHDELDESAAANKRKLFQHFKQNWADYFGEPTGAVFGLASAISGPSIALLLCWTVVLVLLLGDGMVASLASLFVVGFVALELGVHEYSLMPIWSALCSHAFYALGHEPTFSAIPWHAAFVGVPGNFSVQAIPGLLIILSLTAGHVLISMALPLLLVWRSYPNKIGLLGLNPANDYTEHDLLQEKTASRMTNISLLFLSLQAIKMMAATFASAVHKRHLMVWKIFAPKFIFEGVSFVVTCFFVIAINLFIRRLLAKVPSMEVVNRRNRVTFRFRNMLVGDLIKENVAGAELKWALFTAAVRSYKAETLVKPFPPMFINDGDKDFDRLGKAVASLPYSMKQLQCSQSFDQLTTDQQQLVDWLLRSTDYDIKQVTDDEVERVRALCQSQTEAPSPSIIFRVNYSDRIERRFTDARGDRNTLFAYHGSAFYNFSSILRHGLISNMNKVSAFGEGTYLSTELSLSLNWSPMSQIDSKGKRVGCVALCEVVQDLSGVKIGTSDAVVDTSNKVPSKYFIVRNDELVIVRYLLVYEQEGKPLRVCDQQRFLHRAAGWISAHRFWLLMCLYFGLLIIVGLASSSSFRFYWKRLSAQYWSDYYHNDHRHYEET